mgnify:CR=1 FL=1
MKDNMSIEQGAKAFDKNGRFVGEVDKTLLNFLTGETAYLFIRDKRAKRNVICEPADVVALSQKKLRLNFWTG